MSYRVEDHVKVVNRLELKDVFEGVTQASSSARLTLSLCL